MLAAACSSGGSDSSGQGSGSGPPAPPPIPPSYVRLASDAGDFIGAGNRYSYSNANALLTVTASGAHLTITVEGDESWRGEFQLPDGYNELQEGSYDNLQRYPFHDTVAGGMAWSGEHRGCNILTGWLIIDSVTYDGTMLTGIDLEFEQHCEGGAPALHGQIHWDANDSTTPAGPAAPPPPDLWKPAAGDTPSTGNYVYLESDLGDWVGGGGSYLYTGSDSVISATGSDAHLSVTVRGDEQWFGDFQGMNILSRLEPGYYGGLKRFPFHNPVKGGMNFSGEGRACNVLTGWFVVDHVTYTGTTLESIELRFEQHCEGGTTALHGEIHWDANDPTTPPGPEVPPPAGLWEPAPGLTPSSGNYVYLESEPGDFVGSGGSYLYTADDSSFTVNIREAGASITVNGDTNWYGNFQGMDSLERLEVGYYGDLQGYPFNPAKGGLDWSGAGRGCNSLTGWFVVDSVTYDRDMLLAIDLRFEQHCAGAAPALHGKIHWESSYFTNPPGPPGPVVPPPEGLWEPASGITPATGNYVYLESETGDPIGLGSSYLYTGMDSVLSVTATGGLLTTSVNGDEYWNGYFKAKDALARLEVGYYGGLRDYPDYDPLRGGLSWSGQHVGCGPVLGWFVIDRLTYDGDSLTAIDLRFEQHCEDGGPALHGKIHWDANDTTSPPGPVVPPPAGLWEPATGVTPASGNYVYLESESGDYIGLGGGYLYTSVDSIISVTRENNYVRVSIAGDKYWTGDFQGMNTLNRLKVGYYGDLDGYPIYNPAKGGMAWSGDGRACNTLTGWFAVDSVTYDGASLVAIDLRFEQHCEGAAAALHGEIHWDANDTTGPPGPIVPPPADLWSPAPGITPASGNYVYLESQKGDAIGLGKNYLYTLADANIRLDVYGNYLSLRIDGDENWSGSFQTMSTLTRFEAGYYGDLTRTSGQNPAKGGLDWGGEGRGCNGLTGWFAVDNVTYDGEALTAIDLRFEQHCDGDIPALHGEIHWTQ
jgi:hypothetical protein